MLNQYFSCTQLLKTSCHSILLETSFCVTRVFWTNLVCSERCWVSIRKQVQITASWLEPFTLKTQRIFALTFWFSIKDGLGIFKQLINWSSWKRGHLQSHSSWCVSVNWEFRIGAINIPRSWQIGILVITLKFASIGERCLDSMLPGCTQWTYTLKPSSLPVIRNDDFICLICIIWIRVRTLGPWFVLQFWVVHIPVLGNSVNSNT